MKVSHPGKTATVVDEYVQQNQRKSQGLIALPITVLVSSQGGLDQAPLANRAKPADPP